MKNFFNKLLNLVSEKDKNATTKSENKKPLFDNEQQLLDLIDAKKIRFRNPEAKQMFKDSYEENTFKNLICADGNPKIIERNTTFRQK